jgi:nucleoside-specific channel-forming protein
MSRYQKFILVMWLVISFTGQAYAQEIETADFHAKDFKWFQFNLMESVDNKIPFGLQDDTYLEMEFGGRSGAIDLYGFLDIYDIFDSSQSDFHNGDNFFFKFQPRFSLNVMSGKDLSLGPIKEWYIASLFYIADRALFTEFIGVGTDVEVPWFGKMGVNLMARYVRENFGEPNEESWDGYLLSINWFTPFHTFDNKSYLAYQGYFDHIFGATEISDGIDRSDSSIGWFNGLYWHTGRYAAAYGLKIYQNMSLFKDGGIGGETSGAGHYFIVTYKF